ncbi:MAG: helix-turn-helix domain-containing protein [Clostridiales Family XIII bacterium]|jgi:transcriptional regulator with XRE-family HTH domain|nr:helix-turn-helix domain-containing protein [Clostridiales Family XIII bacterium]
MTLGETVKEYRDKHDLSQRQFAAKCNLSNGYISMLEKNINPKTGQPMVPSILAIKKIADAMNISLNSLLYSADDISVDISLDVGIPLWEDTFRNNLWLYLKNMNPKDLEAVGLEQEYIMEIFHSNRRISLEEACDIVDKLGLSFDYMLGMTDKTEKPALGAKDGLDSEIINLFVDLPAELKTEALNYMRYLADRAKT